MKSKSVKSYNLCKSVIQTFIVKAHGGDLRVGTKENIGAEFIFTLPIT
jgi:signal transduction histidine kinase